VEYFNYTINGPKVNLYPIVCWHVGAKQSSEKFIAEVSRQIQDDPLARVIYMGDAGECVTKASKGNIYEQLLNPGDQLRVAAELMKPFTDKILFGIRGNHGNRIDKETGVGWDEFLCSRVGFDYKGVGAFGNIVLKPSRDVLVPVSLYTHHGSAGAITPAGKMAAGHKPEQLVLADVALTAHTHACGECWPAKHLAYVDPVEGIKWRMMRMFVCGSAYDSRSGYAEEKQYPVLLPQHIVVSIEATRSGEVNITSRTIDGFESRYIIDGDREKWTS